MSPHTKEEKGEYYAQIYADNGNLDRRGLVGRVRHAQVRGGTDCGRKPQTDCADELWPDAEIIKTGFGPIFIDTIRLVCGYFCDIMYA